MKREQHKGYALSPQQAFTIVAKNKSGMLRLPETSDPSELRGMAAQLESIAALLQAQALAVEGPLQVLEPSPICPCGSPYNFTCRCTEEEIRLFGQKHRDEWGPKGCLDSKCQICVNTRAPG